MSKQAVIKWNANQLQSIKRDILFFDKFYYDPFLFELQVKLLENVSNLMNYSPQIINEICANVECLKQKGVLEEVELNEFKKRNIRLINLEQGEVERLLKIVSTYDTAHQSFLRKYEEIIKILQNNHNQGFLKYINLLNDFTHFADHHVRLTTVLLEKTQPNLSITPIIENLNDIEAGKETEVIKLIIKNLPIPDERTPLDEILDFKRDENNKRRYLGLINWVNKISKSNLNQNEIEDELQFYTLEFENSLKLENKKYRLSNIEVIVSLPIEIIENLIKLRWSEIPKSLFQIEKNKINLLLEEIKAPGREVAYLTFAKKKFNNL